MKKIRVMTINKDGANVVEVENTHRALNSLVSWTDAWNTPFVRVEGRFYIVICADTGKMRREKISALSCDAVNRLERLSEPFFVGDLIITKFDGKEDFESLNDKDICILKSRLISTQPALNRYFYSQILAID